MINEIKKYIPKKYIDKIEDVNIQADFNYDTNRSCQLYTIYLKDGNFVCCRRVSEISNKLKDAIEI